MALKQDPVYLCPTQGNKIESVVIRECSLVFFLVLNRVIGGVPTNIWRLSLFEFI